MNFYTNVIQKFGKIYVRSIENGKNVKRIVEDYQPSFYMQKEDGKFHDIYGNPLSQKKLKTINEAMEFSDSYSNTNVSLYGVNDYQLQFISDNYPSKIEFDSSLIRTFIVDIECPSNDGFPTPEKAEHPITSITVYDNITKKYYVFGLETNTTFKTDRKDVMYYGFKKEKDLLMKFCEFWKSNEPSIYTGWNIEGFDVAYKINRIKSICGANFIKYLSPWGVVKPKVVRDDFKNERHTYKIEGVAIIDYINLYKKYTYNKQESYSLDFIAGVELKENKIDYSDVGSLYDLYHKDFQRFIEYNIRDVELVKRIDDKMKLLELMLTISYMIKLNYEDTFGSIKPWEAIIYNRCRENGVFNKIKSYSFNGENIVIGGGFCKEPQLGIIDYVMSFDLNSLYPHIIMQCNISPETINEDMTLSREEYLSYSANNDRKMSILNKFIDKSFKTENAKEFNVTITPNLVSYNKNKTGLMPQLMEEFYKQRKSIKNLKLKYEQELEDVKNKGNCDEIFKLESKISSNDNEQMALKILLNAFYGSVANKYFQFHDIRMAESITFYGQFAIQWIGRKLNEYMNGILKTYGIDYIIASDTDSIYITVKDFVYKNFKKETFNDDELKEVIDFMDKLSKLKIEPFIEKCYEEMAEYTNAFGNKMVMKRESIALRAIWTTKKRYGMRVVDSEGVRYSSPKIKVVGLETTKSSTPKVCRETLKEVVKIILSSSNEKLTEYVLKCKKEFKKFTIEEISFPRGVSDINKYYVNNTLLFSFAKGAPKHVKAALLYNFLINKLDMIQLQPIKNGDKIKYIDLKTPNQYHSDVIGFPSHLSLPKEFDLHSFIDYDNQFKKAFLSPLGPLLKSAKWDIERKSAITFFLE